MSGVDRLSVIRRCEWYLHVCRVCGDERGEDPCKRCGDDGRVRTIEVVEKQAAEDNLRGAVEDRAALVSALEGARNTLRKAGFGICADACDTAIAAHGGQYDPG